MSAVWGRLTPEELPGGWEHPTHGCSGVGSPKLLISRYYQTPVAVNLLAYLLSLDDSYAAA